MPTIIMITICFPIWARVNSSNDITAHLVIKDRETNPVLAKEKP